jgi:hypothetical protein|tara:strand:+ start:1389 stop:1847 length:459 start_codon:yes stop_codon:yes gene_type:complete
MAEEKIMIQGDRIQIDSVTEIGAKIGHLVDRLNKWDYSKPAYIKVLKGTRSLNQNDLFHKWCREMSSEWSNSIPNATPEGVKWMMKFKFLGTEDIEVGKTIIKDQVKSTATLDVGEFVFFMDQVYAFAADKNLHLTLPANNQYSALKAAQEQ